MDRASPSRRELLTGVGLVAAVALLPELSRPALAAEGRYPVQFGDAEWRRRLPPAAYQVLRHEGTEPPFTSALNAEHRPGTFACAGCARPLFSSTRKFDSGTGWPSFWAPLPRAVGEQRDTSLMFERTEVHCLTCGGHLGHVFDDGPKPTGLRYCMNGVAMRFLPAKRSV